MRLAVNVFRTLEAYLRAQIRISLILSLVYAAGFAIFHVPAWAVFALLAGFLQAVPVFGSLVALLLTAGLTWMGGGDGYRLLGVFATWLVAQGLEGFYLTPRIMGRRLQLRPMTIFLGLLFGGAIFGFFGILFAVPAMAVAMVVWRHFNSRQQLLDGDGHGSDRVLPSHPQSGLIPSRRIE